MEPLNLLPSSLVDFVISSFLLHQPKEVHSLAIALKVTIASAGSVRVEDQS